MLDKSALQAFEADVASCYERGEIRAPVHLAGGNEDDLVRIFERIRPQDWVCGAWRTHLHCLLKGVPQEQVKASIDAGWSITLNYPKYKILTSAIAGGIISQAVGIADGIKSAGADEHVWCFVGDMTEHMGAFHEGYFYALGHYLPITFVVEDNGLSVCTETEKTWQGPKAHCLSPRYVKYKYKLAWPHQGIGRRVSF
jgi:TPP-dependent pyruvate/acetoin dehydrogenase alpha subunit